MIACDVVVFFNLKIMEYYLWVLDIYWILIILSRKLDAEFVGKYKYWLFVRSDLKKFLRCKVCSVKKKLIFYKFY